MELLAVGPMVRPTRLFAVTLGYLLALSCVEGGPGRSKEAHPKVQGKLLPASEPASLDVGRLRGAPAAQHHAVNTSVLHEQGKRAQTMPCQCDLNQNNWVACQRTVPKCIFIDLGAANGNTFNDFLAGKYGPLASCHNGQWEAVLVEANPRFDAPLKQLEVAYPGNVHAATSSAAYMCEGQTSFYLDTNSHANNYWGSSMSPNHVDAVASGHKQVTVPTVNIMKVLYETAIPIDYVILKMDIEGAEWDILPCVSNWNSPNLMDRLLVEMHPQGWGNAGTTPQMMDTAFATLRSKGVDIPNNYHSGTF